jgi:hypothetical protein
MKRGLERQYSSRSNIICIDVDSENDEIKKGDNYKKDNVILFKRNINEIKNEIKSDSIIGHNNKRKNNYLGFKLKEKNILKEKGNEGGGNISLLKMHKNASYKPFNTYKYIINLKRKSENKNNLKIPIKGIKNRMLFGDKLNKSQIINIKIKDYKKKNKEDKKIEIEDFKNEINNINNIDNDGKDEIIKNLKSENDNLKKLSNENSSLLNKLKELEEIKREDNLKLDEMNKEKDQMKIKYDLLKFKNESINNDLKKLKEGIEKFDKEN